MRFLTFIYKGRESWGAVVDGDVVDLGSRAASLAEFVGSADFAKRNSLLTGSEPKIPMAEIKFLPVIPKPEKIVLLVRNYMDHHQEVLAAGMKRELSAFPPIFLRVWRSQIGHGAPIIRPKISDQLDWEGELAIVIGKGGRHIPEDRAMDHIAGYSCYNDVSVRDWQFHAQQIAAGKNFVGTGPFGPFMVTPDEVPDPNNLKLEVRLNNEVVQSSNTSHLIHKIPRMISYSSTIFDLVPGDVIVTGTPAGVGWSRKPPRFMKAGDIMEVEIEKVGLLRNPVENEA